MKTSIFKHPTARFVQVFKHL